MICTHLLLYSAFLECVCLCVCVSLINIQKVDLVVCGCFNWDYDPFNEFCISGPVNVFFYSCGIICLCLSVTWFDPVFKNISLFFTSYMSTSHTIFIILRNHFVFLFFSESHGFLSVFVFDWIIQMSLSKLNECVFKTTLLEFRKKKRKYSNIHSVRNSSNPIKQVHTSVTSKVRKILYHSWLRRKLFFFCCCCCCFV